jgi:hypothetical protein
MAQLFLVALVHPALLLPHAPSALVSIGHAYTASLAAHPMLTKSAVCAGLFSASDAIAQCHEQWSERRECAAIVEEKTSHGHPQMMQPSITLARPAALDAARSGRMALYAAGIDAPLSNWFVTSLESLVPGTHPWAIFAKAAASQVLWAPFIVAVFLCSHALMRGQGIEGSLRALRTKWSDTIAASFKVWPMVYAVQFAFVPEEHRVPFMALVNLFWVAFLSAVESRRGTQAQAQVEVEASTTPKPLDVALALRAERSEPMCISGWVWDPSAMACVLVRTSPAAAAAAIPRFAR